MSVHRTPPTHCDELTSVTPRRPQRLKRSIPVSGRPTNGTASPLVQKLREKFESAKASPNQNESNCRPSSSSFAAVVRDGGVGCGECPGNLYSYIRKNLQPTSLSSVSTSSEAIDVVDSSDPRPESEIVRNVPRKPNAVEAAIYARPVKSKSSVLQRARQFDDSVVRSSSFTEDSVRRTGAPNRPTSVLSPVPNGMTSSNGTAAPPIKPPRTFAHDIYAKNRLLQRNPMYGQHLLCAVGSSQSAQKRDAPVVAACRVPRPPTTRVEDDAVIHEYDEVCVEDVTKASSVGAAAPRRMMFRSKLRRSMSDEHIYAEPEPLPARRQTADDDTAVFSRPSGRGRESAAKRELHYMSSPIAGAGDDGLFSPSSQRSRAFTYQIRDAINQSFTSVRKQVRTAAAKSGDQAADSSSEVSVKDVQKRLVYVRSIKRAYMESPVSDCTTKAPVLSFVFVVGYKSIDDHMPSQPEVLYRFPKETSDYNYDPLVIAHLCLPLESGLAESESSEREIFYFSLVRENGEKTFFHCLKTSKCPSAVVGDGVQAPVVLCLATEASAPAFYHKLVSDLEEPLARLSEAGWSDLLGSLAKQCVPSPGCKLVCQRLSSGQGDVALATARPLDDKFDWVKLTPLLSVLEDSLLLRIISSLVLERRIILVSANHVLLRGWVEAVESLLYPFKWRHVRVPLLPKSLLVQCSSPEPYLLGVPDALAHMALEILSGPVLVVDVDRGTLLSEDEDNRDVIPKKLQKALCMALSLAKNMTDPTERVRDMMITEAFVRLFVELVGHCDQHVSFLDGSGCGSAFQREAFVKAPSSRGAQMFLQWFVETQAFELFLQERVERLRQLAKTPQHHLLPKGFFERRANEYLLDLEQSGRCLREFGKKVKNIGEKLRNLKAFQRD
ncbi:DENN domain-containing protein 2B isoform X1 [Ixodes scapularis]